MTDDSSFDSLQDLYLLYSVHIGPWSNPTSYAGHIAGYFVLRKTGRGVRFAACHLLLKTVVRLKMKKLCPHFPQYHNPFSLMLTPCTTRLIIHTRCALNSNYCPAGRVSMFVVPSNAFTAIEVGIEVLMA